MEIVLKKGNREVKLNNNLILAPMAGLTDKAFRKICRAYDPGLVVTEMVSAKAIMYGDEKTKRLMDTSGEERPIAVQIFGSDVEAMKYATEYICKNDIADIIDINMGCPAPKIVKNGDGSKLLLNEELIYDIVSAVVSVSDRPVSVKIRKGWDKEHINAVSVAKIIEKAGANMLTIHGRTRSEFYSGEADWDIIKEVKANVNIPVIANGDINTANRVKEALEYTKCDGVMIARAALGNPFIFKYAKDYLENGTYEKVSNLEKLEVMTKHIDYMVEEKGEYVAIREMRKHILYYVKGEENASMLKRRIVTIESTEELKEFLRKFYKDGIIE